MKIKHFVLTAAMTAAVGLVQSTTASAQAATLGGSGSCANVTFTYISCAGYYEGNDVGAKGTALGNLNTLFPDAPWTLVGGDENGTVTFGTGGLSSTSGTASTLLSGFGAFAVKAGNSYSLYTVANLAQFDWSTAGVNLVGKKGNTPGLSHLSIYQSSRPEVPPPATPVPEPGMLLGLVAAAGIGSSLKRKAGSTPA